jgi:hypothetical protein
MALKLSDNTPDSKTPTVDEPDGAFLDKSAGIPGSPVQAGMRNDMVYFFSRIMAEVGIAFNNIQDNITNSQYFTAFVNFLKPVTIIALDGVPITVPLSRHFTVLMDSSLGDPDLPAFDGTFEGQKCTVISDGSGTTTNLAGTGEYVNGVFISPRATGLSYKKTWLDGAWFVVNEVTNDFISGGIRVEKRPNGFMSQSGRFIKDNGLVTAQVIPYQQSFLVNNGILLNQISSGTTTMVTAEDALLSYFSAIIIVMSTGSASLVARECYQKSEGTY